MADLDERKLSMMKNKILRLERKNALSHAKGEKAMVEEIQKIINDCEKMQMGGSFHVN